ncbi:MAG: GNAT family N-acetyltransferase [Clostridia bacterium]|nr:GNAT family N-acetyltransferase [Clostridia bacterium]
MKLKTERLTLEPLGIPHFKTACQYSLNPENAKMMCFLPCDNEKEVYDYLVKCEQQWKKDRPEYIEMAILFNGVHIGAVSVEFVEKATVGELGWIINKDYWGNGYTVEAARALVDYCKEKYGLTYYIAHADSENHASIRIMEKLGMKFVEKHGGRKNRISDEIREEVLYEINL